MDVGPKNGQSESDVSCRQDGKLMAASISGLFRRHVAWPAAAGAFGQRAIYEFKQPRTRAISHRQRPWWFPGAYSMEGLIVILGVMHR